MRVASPTRQTKQLDHREKADSDPIRARIVLSTINKRYVIKRKMKDQSHAEKTLNKAERTYSNAQ
ncbi:MAG: hypothetical protein JKY01_03620 [Pseudomonadales bacterium]|nr:hypothetical protein [Pseudomonadales bacterium]